MPKGCETEGPDEPTPPAVDNGPSDKQAAQEPPATPAEVEMLWMRLAEARPRRRRVDSPSEADAGSA